MKSNKEKIEKLVEERINNFLGYGNLESKIWFIGIEEGCEGNNTNTISRLKATQKKAVVDIQDDMKEIKEHIKWFNPPKIQRTWKALIYILLTLKSEEEINSTKIKNFQKNNFGKKNGDHCIIDFLPLPSPSTKEWIYSNWADKFSLNFLKTRKEYERKVGRKRIDLLQKTIKKYNPDIIIFFGYSKLYSWKKIAQCEFKDINLSYGLRLFYCNKGKTHFFVIPHPAYYKMRKHHNLDLIAKNIKKLANQQIGEKY